jgi:opacity protein-like surface antigen
MKRLTAVTLAAALIFCAASAQAASINPTLDDRFQIRLGPFFANMDSKITLSSGQAVDLEEQFDDNAITGAIYLNWRVTPRINLEFGYSQITRDESETLDQSVPLGDLATLPAGSKFTGEFNTRVYRFGAAYSVFRNEKSEFGISVGVSALNLEDNLAFTPAGGPKITLLESDTTEPMGSIGISGTYAFSPQWSVNGRVGYLGVSLGDIDGTMWDVFGGVEFRPWKNIGLGLAYAYNDADITVQKDSSDTDVNWTYHGPFAYVLIGFGTVAK